MLLYSTYFGIEFFNYSTESLEQVCKSELQNFEKELIIQVKIENEVLFPKALSLEKEAL